MLAACFLSWNTHENREELPAINSLVYFDVCHDVRFDVQGVRQALSDSSASRRLLGL